MARYVVYIVIDNGVVIKVSVLDNKKLDMFTLDWNDLPLILKEKAALLKLLDSSNTNVKNDLGFKYVGGSVLVYINHKEYMELYNEHTRKKGKG